MNEILALVQFQTILFNYLSKHDSHHKEQMPLSMAVYSKALEYTHTHITHTQNPKRLTFILFLLYK